MLKKRCVVFFALLCLCETVFPQIRVSSGFTPFTFDEMVQPYLILQQAQNQIAGSINELYDYIVDVLGHDIDEQLRQEMNQNLRLLENVADNFSKTGHVGDARNGYNTIYRNVQKEIANYNNRIAQERERRARQEAERRAKAEYEASKPQNWSGTGFALKDRYVVTNYHVVEEAKSITIRGIKGDFNKSYPATVVGSDKINDLALLKISDPSFQGFWAVPYSITSTTAEVGEDVFVLGYPLTSTMGDEIKLTTGVISSKTGFQGDVALYQISAPIQPGNSGGPLFDKKGNVIGVVSAKHAGAENVGYAIKSSYLRNLIESSTSSSIIPTNNTVSSLPLTDKVKIEKNFVFYIHCSYSEVSSNNQNQYTNKSSNTKTIFFPSYKSKGDENLKIISITITPSETMFFCMCKNPFSEGWMSIDKTAYIVANGIKYKLTKADGIAYSPQITRFDYPNQIIPFKLIFQPIPLNSTSLDFIESQTSIWKIFGIDLTK